MNHAATTTNPSDTFLSTSVQLLLGLLAWLTLALTAVSFGLMDDPPRPLIPALIWGPVLFIAVMFWRTPALKTWLTQVDPRWLVGYHLIRLIFGIVFLVMYYQHQTLPEAFAVPAGYGDIIAGLLALAIMVAPGKTPKRRWWSLMVFNVIGLADIFMVFMTAQWIFFTQVIEGLGAFTRFPFNLLPLFIVPMIFTTHILLFMRLRWTRDVTAPEGSP